MGFDLVFRVLRQEEYLEGWKYPRYSYVQTFVFSKATFEHSLSIQAPEVVDKSRYLYGTLYSMWTRRMWFYIDTMQNGSKDEGIWRK